MKLLSAAWRQNLRLFMKQNPGHSVSEKISDYFFKVAAMKN